MKKFTCHSERSEESLTNVRPTYVGDPSLIAQDDIEETQDDRKSDGFTLVEIVVVMAIVAIVGTIMVVIFTNTLRASNKAQILSAIKQNGQSVLENMDKTIRNADNVVCPSALVNSGSTLVIVKNGIYSRFRFIPPNDSNKRCVNSTSANGCIQQDNPVQPTPPPTTEEFITILCTDTDPLINPVTLTDTNSQSGTSVLSGSFTRNTQQGFKDSVAVSFILGPGVGAPSVVAGQIDPVSFQTTVQLR